MIIDVHSHIFPDPIAVKAAVSIGDFYDIHMRHDGKLETMLTLDAEAGIGYSCVHSVAITPKHIGSINRFISGCVKDHPGRLTGFGAIHPDYEDIPSLIDEVREMGLKGFKIHPDMQKFALDDPRAMDMFAAMEGKMPVIIHTGDNRHEYSRPYQMKKVLEAFPKLICVCAHLGGWSEWTEAWKTLAGFENIYVDTCSSLYAMTREEAVKVIRTYDRERVLFGTDFPMWTPAEEVERFMALNLTSAENEMILETNARRFLGLR